jgi:hypothetical protein
MEAMDQLNPAFARLLAAKEARRRRLARAPFPEKIEALVRLQAMAAPIQRRRGREVGPWRAAERTAGGPEDLDLVLDRVPARPPLPGDELPG